MRASESAMPRVYLPVACAGLLAMLLAAPARAQVERSGGGASAALLQQMQQLASERTQLQSDNAKLNQDLADAKKQLDAMKQQLAAAKQGAGRDQAQLTAQLAAQKAANATSSKSLEDTNAKMQELIGRFRDTLVTLRNTEDERNRAQQQLQQRQTAYDKCAVANDDLYHVTSEVLDRYEHQGVFSYLQRAEPFTRLKRTQIDNLALDYEQRAQELRVKKSDSAAAGGAPSPGATAPPSPAGNSKPN